MLHVPHGMGSFFFFLIKIRLYAKSPQSCLTLCNSMDCRSLAPLSMRFSTQEYWSELSRPLPGDLPNPEIKSASLMSPALASGFFTTSATWEAQTEVYVIYNVLVSGVHQSDSVTHILFHSGLSQDSEYSSLCYTVGPCCLPIPHIIVCIY